MQITEFTQFSNGTLSGWSEAGEKTPSKRTGIYSGAGTSILLEMGTWINYPTGFLLKFITFNL